MTRGRASLVVGMAWVVAACVPPEKGGLHRSETGQPRDSEANEDTGFDTAGDSGATDTADTDDLEAGWHTCPDVPWVSVEVGFEVACGIHEGGCIECWGASVWGRWTEAVYDEPDIEAVDLTLHAGWGDDYEDTYGPFGCAKAVDSTWSCWGTPLTRPWEMPSLDDAEDIGVGEPFMAVLYRDGLLRLRSFSLGDSLAIEGVAPPLSVGNSHACAALGVTLHCWDYSRVDGAIEIGPVGEWRQFVTDSDFLLGVRGDGSVVSVGLYWDASPEQLAPPGSPWVSVRGIPSVDWLTWLTNEAGETYTLNALDGPPIFPEPTKSFDVSGWGTCGVTFDGRMECNRDYAEVYPPPGSYIVEL